MKKTLFILSLLLLADACYGQTQLQIDDKSGHKLTLKVDTLTGVSKTWLLPGDVGDTTWVLSTRGHNPDTLYWGLPSGLSTIYGRYPITIAGGDTVTWNNNYDTTFGSVDTVAPANATLVTSPNPITRAGTIRLNLNNANTWLAKVGIFDATDEVPFFIQNGAPGNVSDLLEVRDFSGSPVLSIGDEGEIKVSGSYGSGGYYLTSGGAEAACTWTLPPTIPTVDSNYVQFNPYAASPHQIIYPQTDFVPLTINDTVTGALADLQDWEVGGGNQARIDKDGWLWNSAHISENSIAWWNHFGQIQSTLLQKGQLAFGGGTSQALYFDTLTARPGISVDNGTLGKITISQATTGNPDSGGYIVNQNSALQTANYRISGNSYMGGSDSVGGHFVVSSGYAFIHATTGVGPEVEITDTLPSGNSGATIGLEINSSIISPFFSNYGLEFNTSIGNPHSYDIYGTSGSWIVDILGNATFNSLTLGGALTVPNGGTGASSFTADMPVLGGITSTAALQSVSTTNMAAGDVLSTTYSVGGTAAAPVWNHAPIVGSGTPFNGSAPPGTATSSFTFPGTVTNKYVIDHIYVFATSVAGFVSNPSISFGSIGAGYTDLLPASVISSANVTTAYTDLTSSLVNPRNFQSGGTTVYNKITTSGVGIITLETDILYHAMK